MAKLVIRDLPESVELDRKAMRSITGGKATGPRMGVASYHSSLFNNPLSFRQLRIIPGIRGFNSSGG